MEGGKEIEVLGKKERVLFGHWGPFDRFVWWWEIGKHSWTIYWKYLPLVKTSPSILQGPYGESGRPMFTSNPSMITPDLNDGGWLFYSSMHAVMEAIKATSPDGGTKTRKSPEYTCKRECYVLFCCFAFFFFFPVWIFDLLFTNEICIFICYENVLLILFNH